MDSYRTVNLKVSVLDENDAFSVLRDVFPLTPRLTPNPPNPFTKKIHPPLCISYQINEYSNLIPSQALHKDTYDPHG